MGRRAKGGESLPHAHYGVDLSKVPDTYVEPFVAYRAWNWKADGITSLNHEPWTPKVAFEATCRYNRDLNSLKAACASPEADEFWGQQNHHVPDADCTCGMYAGINMQHLIDIGYIERGVHGEVHLWGRLMRHTLGWRAQYAYPKYFVVPAGMIPMKVDEAQKRLASLVEFGVDIFLQTEREAKVGQITIPLWVPDYGYSSQGIDFLVERWKSGRKMTIAPLAVGDRVAVFGMVSGIGIVKEIKDERMYYTMFAPDKIYSKPIKDVKWNESNWRWETTGTGSVRGV